jgi:hypothetical protein
VGKLTDALGHAATVLGKVGAQHALAIPVLAWLRGATCSPSNVDCVLGLALALMCGDYRVIVTANDSEKADSSALDRLLALRGLYGSDFPACQHLLQIGSSGALTTFKARRIEGGYSLAVPK